MFRSAAPGAGRCALPDGRGHPWRRGKDSPTAPLRFLKRIDGGNDFSSDFNVQQRVARPIPECFRQTDRIPGTTCSLARKPADDGLLPANQPMLEHRIRARLGGDRPQQIERSTKRPDNRGLSSAMAAAIVCPNMAAAQLQSKNEAEGCSRQAISSRWDSGLEGGAKLGRRLARTNLWRTEIHILRLYHNMAVLARTLRLAPGLRPIQGPPRLRTPFSDTILPVPRQMLHYMCGGKFMISQPLPPELGQFVEQQLALGQVSLRRGVGR